jgi:hypothetical protein
MSRTIFRNVITLTIEKWMQELRCLDHLSMTKITVPNIWKMDRDYTFCHFPSVNYVNAPFFVAITL